MLKHQEVLTLLVLQPRSKVQTTRMSRETLLWSWYVSQKQQLWQVASGMEEATRMQLIRSHSLQQASNLDDTYFSPWLTKSIHHLLQASVDMMRKVLNTVNMDGVIVIGEGEKDEVI